MVKEERTTTVVSLTPAESHNQGPGEEANICKTIIQSRLLIHHIIKEVMDSVHLSAQVARGRYATPCGRSNGATKVGEGGRPLGPPHARSARRAAQRLGSRSDASHIIKGA